MPKYLKKPVVVEAVQVSKALNAACSWPDLPDWLKVAYGNGDILFLPNSVEIRTLEGLMTGNLTDYIIQGVKGELYPCKPDIFEQTYELVE
jgi:hypothetical protein